MVKGDGMQKKNQKTVDDFLSRADAIGDDVMADMETMLGSLPYIFPVLREREETFALSMLADYRIFRPEHLPRKMAEIAAIAAAAGAGADKCLKVHITAAIKEGVTRDEIFDALMIAATIGKTKVFASALRTMCDAFPRETASEGTDSAGSSKKSTSARKRAPVGKHR